MDTKIGIYSAGLRTYWSQFAGLKQRLEGYNAFLAEKMSGEPGVTVCNFGLVDSDEAAKKAGEYFNQNGVTAVFCHIATYVDSASVLPVHQICKAPVILLNLQPSIRVNYEKTGTGEWLAHCGACAAPEICNALDRAEIPYELVSGLLGLEVTPKISVADETTCLRPEAIRAWGQIFEWIRAAKAVSGLSGARFGFLGNYYSGMLDMYSDFTLLQSKTGIHVEVLEMCDLRHCLENVTEAEVARKRREISELFQVSGDSPSEPLAKAPTEAQLDWSARVAAAEEKLAADFRLNALTYYYHGRDGNEYEELQSGLIVGNSLLTAKGIPCAGEADVKTAIAMKICDLLGVGGSFCEIVTTDYEDGTILVGHDGPFHIRIADGKPILRGLGIFHGKRGSGVSVEAKVRKGPVTTLGLTQTAGGKLRAIVSEGISTDGQIMQIGNTQTPVRFALAPDEYMEKWFKLAPTHHFALSVGHNAGLLVKVMKLLKIECSIL